mmetsp:Transcript_24210/g.81632  ORF Transcript_24210/g.81632 Transcript_24210/m.81632 type:complete len:281 (-) Transcript_24210:2985-3827(-)
MRFVFPRRHDPARGARRRRRGSVSGRDPRRAAASRLWRGPAADRSPTERRRRSRLHFGVGRADGATKAEAAWGFNVYFKAGRGGFRGGRRGHRGGTAFALRRRRRGEAVPARVRPARRFDLAGWGVSGEDISGGSACVCCGSFTASRRTRSNPPPFRSAAHGRRRGHVPQGLERAVGCCFAVHARESGPKMFAGFTFVGWQRLCQDRPRRKAAQGNRQGRGLSKWRFGKCLSLRMASARAAHGRRRPLQRERRNRDGRICRPRQALGGGRLPAFGARGRF